MRRSPLPACCSCRPPRPPPIRCLGPRSSIRRGRRGRRRCSRPRSKFRPSPSAAQMPKMAAFVAAELKKGGWADADIKIMPLRGPRRATRRWRWSRAGGQRSRGKKPILILGHMDVVEAKRADWKHDPFKLRREGRLFLRPRHQRRQAGRDRHRPRRCSSCARRGSSRPRHHRLLHRRRGNRGQWRAARRDRMAQADRRRICAQRRRRRRRLHRRRAAARLRASRPPRRPSRAIIFTARNRGGHS